MPLFPLDIRHQEFSGQMFGYNKKEVRAFLEQVASELDELLRKQERELSRREQMQYEVKQEAVSANSAVEDLKRREELISRTLVFAEKTKADIIANARKEAENIIHEAELKAKRAINEAKQHLSVLEHQYLSIKEQKRQFLMQFKVELQSFQDRINKDPLLSKDTEQLMDGEFKQIKEDIVPQPHAGVKG
ncbi:MAG: DivIVA domain-containing protein [Candidatus Cloacimonetes bacterium]|jgi:DivIVA domain-containing protein|nr:DivIVA domain-containing protein [Candidatus Cloacimonadota bacterium]MDY0298438.1 DivIVA domain-containing protein [Candidatus Cloacimonadaceae bacterium]MCB5279052.1 DivIVA domain-containing protein [Candidatus Cloacimonadota bacterium]MCK9332190.1 DivIVA domain-containing protein [Candidatus Cloacimonadota bacterium]MDD2210154.1 DivIVA domain-containing protein [Candidatus Cloacimonadota bacterium]